MHLLSAALVACLSFSRLCTASEYDLYKRFSHPSNFVEREAEEADNSTCTSTSCYRYYNNKTAPYLIKSWPDVTFPTGEFYGGLVPIDASNPNRSLFFIFQPAMEAPSTDLTIWLNGGPGCSSLEGFLQENGPFRFLPGTDNIRKNPYTWSKLTNMIWVEQPVGTGFSQGKPNAYNEVQVAKQFIGFFKNFLELFGITNYKIYVTGESYAGRYVPYISAEMLDQNDTEYFDLTGALAYDPCIGSWEVVQESIPAYSFAVENNAILNLNDSYMSDLAALNEKCGWTEYIDKYLQFPPPGNQAPAYPTGSEGHRDEHECAIWNDVYEAAATVNNCFDVYHIVQTCPTPKSNLHAYFNRQDVKRAIHAPVDMAWHDCSPESVFIHTKGKGVSPEYGENDLSPDPIQHVLPQVIEATNRTLIGNGDWDYIIITNGTLLSIQNMTWNGALGFQTAPSQDLVVDLANAYGPQGTMGKWHYERGLMWVETYQCGHMEPEFQPRASYMHMMWLLGMIDSF